MGRGQGRAVAEQLFEGQELGAENLLLRRIIEVTSGELGVREVCQRVASLVTQALPADVCFVHMVDDQRRRVLLAGATPPFDELVGSVELAVGEGVAGWVAEHAEAVLIPDKWSDPRYRYIPELKGERYRSMASAPMLVRGKVVGVLNVHAEAESVFGEGDVALLVHVATLMARTVENAQLHARLAEREEAMEALASRVLEAQELERRRLAGEIHDGISQRLISLWYHLLAAGDAGGDPDRLGAELAAAKELATLAIDETRATISGLRPSVLDDLGLGAALEGLARTLGDLAVEVDVAPEPVPGHVEVAMFRIAQEALQNVVKHAEASVVRVSLGPVPDGVRLAITDDGAGLSEDWLARAEERQSYGLVGMRERAELIGGRLSIASRPGRGTTVELVVPTAGGLAT